MRVSHLLLAAGRHRAAPSDRSVDNHALGVWF